MAPSIISSVIVLQMMSRIRWVAASGASVIDAWRALAAAVRPPARCRRGLTAATGAASGRSRLIALDGGGDVGVVAGGERCQRELVVAGAAELLQAGLDDIVGRALAHRPVPGAGMAEAAAARAAAHDLDRRAVEDGRGVRHDRPGGLRLDAEVGVDRALDRVAAAGRHVEVGHRPPAPQALGASVGLARDVDDLLERSSASPMKKHVEERRQRLRVRGARPAGDHDRVLARCGRRRAAESGQVEHLEHVGVAQLGLQGDPQNRSRDRPPTLEGEQRHTLAAHGVRHVGHGQ